MPQIPSYERQATLNESVQQIQWGDPSKGQVQPVEMKGAVAAAFLKFSDEADKARVSDSILKYRKAQADFRYGVKPDGSDGWASKLGAKALEKDKDGYGLVDHYSQELDVVKNSIEGDLSPRQRELFRKHLEPYESSNHAAMRQHVFTQFQSYRENSLTADVDFTVGQFSRSQEFADYNENIASITARTRELGKLKGWSQQETDNKIQTAVSKGLRSGIETMLEKCAKDPSMVRMAEATLDQYHDQMLGGDVLELRKKIDEQNITNLGNETVEKFRSVRRGGGKTLVSRRAGEAALGPSPSGATISEAVQVLFGTGIVGAESGGRHTDSSGSLVLGKYSDGSSPTDERKKSWGVGQVSGGTAIDTALRFGYLSGDAAKEAREALKTNNQKKIAQIAKGLLSDEKMNMRLGMHYLDRLVSKYGDMTKAICAYNQGEGTVDKLIKKATDAGHPEAWLSYATPTAQNYVAKVQKQAREAERAGAQNGTEAQLKLFGGGTFRQEDRSLSEDEVRPWVKQQSVLYANNPDECDKVVKRIMADQAQAKADDLSQRQFQLKRAMDIAYQLGTAGLRGETKGEEVEQKKMELAQMRQTMTREDQMALDVFMQDIKEGGDGGNLQLIAQFSDDNFLRNVTKDQMESAMPLLGKDRKALYIKWHKLQNLKQGVAEDQGLAEQGIVVSGYDKHIKGETIREALAMFTRDKNGETLKGQGFEIFQWEIEKALQLTAQSRGAPFSSALEVKTALVDLFNRHEIMAPSWFGFSTTDKNLLDMKGHKLDGNGPGESKYIVRELARAYNTKNDVRRDKPNDQDMDAAWIALWVNPRAFGDLRIGQPGGLQVDKAKWDYVKKTIADKPFFRGQTPRDIDVLRGYLAFQESGEKIPEEPKKQRVASAVEAPSWGTDPQIDMNPF